MESVMEFSIRRGLPKSTKIKRIAENNEPVVFKQYFESWKEPSIEPQNDEVFNKDQEVNANVQNDDPLPLPHKATDQQVKFLSYILNLTDFTKKFFIISDQYSDRKSIQFLFIASYSIIAGFGRF